MTLYFKNVKEKFVLIFDIEFDQTTLIQFAGLLFEQIEPNVFSLSRSVNVYTNKKVSYPFMNYTRITNNFLEENGVTLKDLVQIVEDDFLSTIDKKDLLIVSHGLKSDINILSQNFINFQYDLLSLEPIHGYCTAANARRILRRNSQLTLEDIANEAGYYVSQPHDAFNDAWATVAAFSFLKRIEE